MSDGRQGQFPDDMPPSLLLRRWFYKTYRWTPEDVDKMPLEELTWLPIIETAQSETEQWRAKRAAAASESKPSKPRPIQGF